MILKIAALLTFVFIAGCAGDRIKPEYFQMRVTSEWIATNDLAVIRLWCPEPLLSCISIDANDRSNVVIVSPLPEYVNDSLTCALGHEQLHAHTGNYHPGHKLMMIEYKGRKVIKIDTRRNLIRW